MLSSGNKPKKNQFQFDLELEMKDNPAAAKKWIETADHRAQELKKALRAGVSEKEFDHLGTLLHGYTALQKVLKKATQ